MLKNIINHLLQWYYAMLFIIIKNYLSLMMIPFFITLISFDDNNNREEKRKGDGVVVNISRSCDAMRCDDKHARAHLVLFY